jgi:hypothetical protein
MALTQEVGRSWSAFPPPAYKRPWAAALIQKAWRRILDKRKEKQLLEKMELAAKVIQRWWRKVMEKKGGRRHKAAIVIQRYFRMRRAQRRYQIAKKYGVC